VTTTTKHDNTQQG
jgi:hypothetical protein